MKYRASLLSFVLVMDDKLERNLHKHSWRRMKFSALMNRLREEMDELEAALEGGADSGSIAQEAADVANFAMMIADKAERYSQ